MLPNAFLCTGRPHTLVVPQLAPSPDATDAVRSAPEPAHPPPALQGLDLAALLLPGRPEGRAHPACGLDAFGPQPRPRGNSGVLFLSLQPPPPLA